MRAKDIMTKDVITVTADVSVQDAIDLIIEKKISGLVVVGETGEMVGVVTEKDFLVAYDFLNETASSIGDFISKDVISVNEDTPIEEISKILVQKNIKRVPVLNEKVVVGIVSRCDVLKHIRNSTR